MVLRGCIKQERETTIASTFRTISNTITSMRTTTTTTAAPRGSVSRTALERQIVLETEAAPSATRTFEVHKMKAVDKDDGTRTFVARTSKANQFRVRLSTQPFAQGAVLVFILLSSSILYLSFVLLSFRPFVLWPLAFTLRPSSFLPSSLRTLYFALCTFCCLSLCPFSLSFARCYFLSILPKVEYATCTKCGCCKVILRNCVWQRSPGTS